MSPRPVNKEREGMKKTHRITKCPVRDQRERERMEKLAQDFADYTAGSRIRERYLRHRDQHPRSKR